MSGCILRIFRPTLTQLNGLHELTQRLIRKSVGATSFEYCVLPGKRNDGYWNVDVTTSTWGPSA